MFVDRDFISFRLLQYACAQVFLSLPLLSLNLRYIYKTFGHFTSF